MKNKFERFLVNTSPNITICWVDSYKSYWSIYWLKFIWGSNASESNEFVIVLSSRWMNAQMSHTSPVTKLSKGYIGLCVVLDQQISKSLLGIFEFDAPFGQILLSLQKLFLWDPPVSILFDILEGFP